MFTRIRNKINCLLGKHFFVLQWSWTSNRSCEVINACLHCNYVFSKQKYRTGSSGYAKMTEWKQNFLGGKDD